MIVRGEGCYLEDVERQALPRRARGLFAVQIGYSYGEEVGRGGRGADARAALLHELVVRHPRAIELAAEVASLAPGDLNRVFFVSGGSEAVESAWKLARQYHAVRGERRWKAVSRRVAYHGTTMGALSINGIPALRAPFEPLVPEVVHVRNTNRYHRPAEETEEEFTRVPARRPRGGDRAGGARHGRDGDHGAGTERGRRFTPPAGYWRGVRELCDHYGILLCADEVITGFGRLGTWFGSERYDIRPDLVTCAKGLSSAYASIGAVVARDAVMEPFLEGTRSTRTGSRSAAIPCMARSRSRTSRS